MVDARHLVSIFVGEERYLKEAAIDALKASLVKGSSETLDCKVFYGAEATAAEIIDYATTFPFFSTKRFALIRDFERLADEDRARLLHYCEHPSKTTYLVIDAKNDSPFRGYSAALPSHAVLVRYDALAGQKLASWIKQFFTARGKGIDDDALEVLQELQGADLLALAQEAEKLIALIGDRRTVTGADVEAVVGKSFIASAFELGWRIGERNGAAALELAYDLMARGKRVHEIVGLLSWHLKQLFKASCLASRGASASAAAAAVGIRPSDRQRFATQLTRYRPEDIAAKMEILLETDLAIKRSAFDPKYLLEFAIVRLAALPGKVPAGRSA